MTHLDLAYFNFEHGGLVRPSSRGDVPGGYDFTGLVRVMGEDDRWPHVFVMGEGDYYEFWGGAGMWGAAEAMREAGGRPYVPLRCGLPREWGPFAPVIFYDAHALVVHRFYDDRAPDFAARNRNLLILRHARGSEQLNIVGLHGDINSQEYRRADAENLRWLAQPGRLSVVLADFNEHLSGPHFEPTDLDDPTRYSTPSHFVHRLVRRDGVPVRPYRQASPALDYLCGHWDHETGRRVEGIGFIDVAERAGLYTGTNLPRPSGRDCVQWDHILVNPDAATRIVEGSTRIHEPIDPSHPDSDHKRLSVTIDL